jgi:hypothetical protein
MVGMNWRSRPLGYDRVFEPRLVRGQCHPFPRGGSHRSERKRPGNEAVSDAEQVRPDRGLRTTVAIPGYAPDLRVEEERRRTQSVKDRSLLL